MFLQGCVCFLGVREVAIIGGLWTVQLTLTKYIKGIRFRIGQVLEV